MLWLQSWYVLYALAAAAAGPPPLWQQGWGTAAEHNSSKAATAVLHRVVRVEASTVSFTCSSRATCYEQRRRTRNVPVGRDDEARGPIVQSISQQYVKIRVVSKNTCFKRRGGPARQTLMVFRDVWKVPHFMRGLGGMISNNNEPKLEARSSSASDPCNLARELFWARAPVLEAGACFRPCRPFLSLQGGGRGGSAT